MGLIPVAPNPDNEGTVGLVDCGSGPSWIKRVEMPFERLFEELTIGGAAEVPAMRFGHVPGWVGANGLSEENVGLTIGRFRSGNASGPIVSLTGTSRSGAIGLDGGGDALPMAATDDCRLPVAEAAGMIPLSG